MSLIAGVGVASAAAELPTRTFILKIAGACNLNCTYCYMYNKGDDTYLRRPRVMSEAVAEAALARVFAYAVRRRIPRIALVLHGGEPLLVGKRWLRWFLERVDALAPADVEIEVGLQTNGLLLDREWIQIFRDCQVHVGVSLDGTPEVHDRYRLTINGKGSYRYVRRAVDLLVAAGSNAPQWGVLAVADPLTSSTEAYRHFLEAGIDWMDFLWPDFHHDSPPPWPQGALQTYYVQLFDAWYGDRNPDICIRWFESVIKLLIGGRGELDALGPHPLTELVVETDGSIEPLDVLRTCGNGMTQLGLNVVRDDVEKARKTNLFQLGYQNQSLLAAECKACEFGEVCGGGYLPHRWNEKRGFSNPSIHCSDLFGVIQHVAGRVLMDLDASRAH